MDRIAIILSITLLVASGASYFVLEAFGQQLTLDLDCPNYAYHGLDGNGNEVCRDIETNAILELESEIIVDSNTEDTKSESVVIAETKTGEMVLNDIQVPIIEIIIIGVIGIIGGIIGLSLKAKKFQIFQGWNSTQKEQVRDRQYGRCNMCFTAPSKWEYDHIDGNKTNHELNNCQGLCPKCHSIKTQKDNQVIYQ